MITTTGERDIEIGRALKRARNAKGLSQWDLANACNTLNGQISDIERGRRSLTLRTARICSDLLDVDFVLMLLQSCCPPGYTVTKDTK